MLLVTPSWPAFQHRQSDFQAHIVNHQTHSLPDIILFISVVMNKMDVTRVIVDATVPVCIETEELLIVLV